MYHIEEAEHGIGATGDNMRLALEGQFDPRFRRYFSDAPHRIDVATPKWANKIILKLSEGISLSPRAIGPS
jgi:hypothetical protein